MRPAHATWLPADSSRNVEKPLSSRREAGLVRRPVDRANLCRSGLRLPHLQSQDSGQEMHGAEEQPKKEARGSQSDEQLIGSQGIAQAATRVVRYAGLCETGLRPPPQEQAVADMLRSSARPPPQNPRLRWNKTAVRGVNNMRAASERIT